MMRVLRVGIGAAVVFIAFGVFAFLGVPRDTMPGLGPYIKSEKVFYEELVGISGPNTFYRRREITTTFHTQTEAMNFLKKAGIPEPDYGNWVYETWPKNDERLSEGVIIDAPVELTRVQILWARFTHLGRKTFNSPPLSEFVTG